jgi:hypothetical protein
MPRTHAALALAVVIISATSTGLAQPAGATPEPALVETQGGASQSTGRGTVVVAADLFPDETSNARLRAGVYEAARQFDLSSLPRADVTGAAESADALEAGQLSTDAAALDRVRRTLTATLLVRVSKEWERGETLGARVTIVSESGTKSQVVEAPAAEPSTAVAGAVAALLEQMYPGSQKADAGPTGASAQPSYLVDPDQPAVGAERPSGTAADRLAWQQRGGVITSYEVRGLVTGLHRPNVGFSDVNPTTDEIETGSDVQWGIGGGVGVRASLLFAALPDPVTGSGSWFGFRLGAGLDGSVLYTRPPIGFRYESDGDRKVQRENKAFFYPTASIQIGPHVGFGQFRTPTIWRGVVLGVAYSPAIVWNLEIGQTEFETDFNYAGFEATLDIASLEARQGVDRESQIRLFAFVLPRIEEQPWLVSLGIGAVWY